MANPGLRSQGAATRSALAAPPVASDAPWQASPAPRVPHSCFHGGKRRGCDSSWPCGTNTPARMFASVTLAACHSSSPRAHPRHAPTHLWMSASATSVVTASCNSASRSRICTSIVYRIIITVRVTKGCVGLPQSFIRTLVSELGDVDIQELSPTTTITARLAELPRDTPHTAQATRARRDPHRTVETAALRWKRIRARSL